MRELALFYGSYPGGVAEAFRIFQEVYDEQVYQHGLFRLEPKKSTFVSQPFGCVKRKAIITYFCSRHIIRAQ